MRRFISSQIKERARAAILDGAETSRIWQGELKKEAALVTRKLGRPPGLAVIIVGDRPDSSLYVQRKQEAAAKVGIATSVERLRSDVSQQELENMVKHLCSLTHVDGLLVQLPLPSHLNEEAVIDSFDPSKDVDGFHPLNVGRLIMQNRQRSLIPCTALGIMELITRSRINLGGKEAVLMGDSNIVGTPLAMLLRDSGIAAHTICSRPSMQALFDDWKLGTKRAAAQVCLPRLPGPQAQPGEGNSEPSETGGLGLSGSRNDNVQQGDSQSSRSSQSFDLASITRRADLLVVAVGNPELVQAHWVKPGAVVLDVGINVVEGEDGESRVVGDVAFEEVSQVAGAISPVPGGIGPMTIAAVLHNTIQAAWMHAGKKQEHAPSSQFAGSR